MDVREVRDLYDQVRARPPKQMGRETAWFDGVLRHTVAYNFIDWWDFAEDRAFEIAAREAAFYAPLGDLKWKVYAHDRPANLPAALAAAGFAFEHLETFVALDLADAPTWPAQQAGLEVRRIADRTGVEDFLAVNAAAFQDTRTWNADSLTERLADPTLAIYVAYADGQPVCGGRLELNPGTRFAGLYGGGTTPEFQGRGIYHQVVAARAAEASRQGFRYLMSDARNTTSLPILKRLGFQPISELTPWRRSGAT
ncbi:MAG TPA: GNAT family N-acetyltransferase [Caulobacteraceae bacterium]|jgi:GNAT superfamily N-acetyltransferase